jgi:hypothetical protein
VLKRQKSNFIPVHEPSREKIKVNDHYNYDRINSFGKPIGKNMRPNTTPLTMIPEHTAQETDHSANSSTLTPLFNSTLTGNNSSALIPSKETSRDTGKDLKESLHNNLTTKESTATKNESL